MTLDARLTSTVRLALSVFLLLVTSVSAQGEGSTTISNSPESGGPSPSSSSSDASTTSDSSSVDNAAGAAGPSSSFIHLTTGATVAIIVVAIVVGGGGIASAILFYVAKKRQWAIRQSIRRSARRVTQTFTPRARTFKEAGVRLDDAPKPKRRERGADVEKGDVKVSERQKTDKTDKGSGKVKGKWFGIGK